MAKKNYSWDDGGGDNQGWDSQVNQSVSGNSMSQAGVDATTLEGNETWADSDSWKFDLDGDGKYSNPGANTTTESSSSNNTPAPAPTPAAPPPTPQELLTTELSSWGGTEEQIQAIMDSLGETSDADLGTLLNQLKEVPKEDRIVHLIDNFGDAVQEWGGAGGTTAIPLNDATRGAELQKSPEERLQAAVDLEVMGSSTGAGLEPVEGQDGVFEDADGNQFFKQSNGTFTDRDGNVRADPGTGLAAQAKDFRDKESGLADKLYGEDGITDQIKTLGTDYNKFVDDSIDSMDFEKNPQNDFASAIGGHIDSFLNGYTDEKTGEEHKGFLDYQSDLMDAGETYKGEAQTLKADYDKTYGNYQKDLDPLRSQIQGVNKKLGGVADMSLDVARDAGSANYYNKLSDLYYSQAQDSIEAGSRGAKAALNESYANAGMDPSSPAFTKAMADLATSRADAMVSAKRQSVLDSYGLGSQMLQNRSSALGNAGAALSNQMAGIGTEMGAMDSLYGVKLAGLGQRNDMIGQIYNIGANNAQMGMQGASTVLESNLNKVNTASNQFYKNMDTTNSLYNSQGNMLNNTANALGAGVSYYGGKGDQAFNTLLEANQGNKSDAFAFGTLQKIYEEEGVEMPDFVKNQLPG
jgi:hypothetical protein